MILHENSCRERSSWAIDVLLQYWSVYSTDYSSTEEDWKLSLQAHRDKAETLIVEHCIDAGCLAADGDRLCTNTHA